MVTREVSCAPAEDGEPAPDCETDGECLASLELPPPLPCDGLAREDARRGLPAEVTARDRLPLRKPPTFADPDGEMSELVEEVDDCLLETCRFAAIEAWLKARFVGEKAASTALGGLPWPAAVVDIGGKPRRGAPLFHTLLCACGRVPACPELAGLPGVEADGRGGWSWAEEGGRWLIETARALEVLVAVVVAARSQWRCVGEETVRVRSQSAVSRFGLRGRGCTGAFGLARGHCWLQTPRCLSYLGKHKMRNDEHENELQALE